MDSGLQIRKVCIVGAGTMGSGIAGHLANLGFQVTLLDRDQETVTASLERARMARPPVFYLPERASDIRIGNMQDHLAWISEADWVCEAVAENPIVKSSVYEALEGVLRPDAMITTNTSGLEISRLCQGRSASFRSRFMGVHFFNPPRYLKLVELIPTPETDPSLVSGITQFLEDKVARRVVVAKDTPGFIANRFGMWALFHAIHVAEKLHMSVEEVDAITGAFIGHPRSGTFRLADVVGLDVMRDIAANLRERCPDDPYIKTLELPKTTFSLLARGWIGEKSGHGYYRREARDLFALDLNTFAYRERRDVLFASLQNLGRLPLGERMKAGLDLRDEVGEFLRHYLVPTLRYADYLKEKVAHNVLDFDRVMTWGFGWEMGPFKLTDAIGVAKLGIDAAPSYRDGSVRSFDGGYFSCPMDPVYRPLSDCPVIQETESLRVRDLRDGAVSVALTTRLGVISPAVVEDLTRLIGKNAYEKLVFTSEAASFSVGFDIKYFLKAIDDQRFEDIDSALAALQELGELLESKDVVAAVFGHCLGGGFELALSCRHIVADAEAQIGLPESRIGLLPAGRGTALTRLYNQASPKRLSEVALTLTEGTISGGADHARALGYLRATDFTSYHPDRLIYEAKRVLLEEPAPPRPVWTVSNGPLAGMIDRALAQGISRNALTGYDQTIGEKIKQIYAKSPTYVDALAKERTEFLDLCHRALTHARLKHMIETKKPLRN